MRGLLHHVMFLISYFVKESRALGELSFINSFVLPTKLLILIEIEKVISIKNYNKSSLVVSGFQNRGTAFQAVPIACQQISP